MITLTHIAKEIENKIKENFDDKELNDSGKAKASISSEVSGNKITISGLGRVLFLEYGREDGEPPPFGIIKDWVERKLNPPSEAVWPIAKSIVKKISEKGTSIFTDRAKGLQIELTIAEILNDAVEEIAKAQAQITLTRIEEVYKD